MVNGCAKWCSLTLLASALAGCGGDGGGEPQDTDTGTDTDTGADAGAEALALATFNTGLAVGYVDWATARLPLIADAVAALDADVLCLQEIWRPEDVDAIVAAAGDAFPYSYFELTEEDAADGGVADGGAEEPACDEAETASLGGCATENCGDVAPENLAGCVLDYCGEEFSSVSSGCSGCLIANLGLTIEEILGICSGGGGGTMAYGGRNGLLLLSRLPIASEEYLLLDSFLNRRIVLHARIEAGGAAGEVDVFCTHLTANLESPEYAGDYGSWEDERAAQIAAALAWIEEVKGDAGRVALLGDMNCGPDTANVDPEYPENYALFAGHGLAAPYIDDPGHACTWCLDNPLVGADTGGGSSVIDHVLLEGWPAGTAFAAERILDGEVTVGGGGEPVATRLSDHYGARVGISVPE